MKTRLAALICLGMAVQVGSAAEPPAPPGAQWLGDANGCKFLAWLPPGMPPVTIQWDGACVDGFVSGPGEVKVYMLVFRGEFAKGRLVKGTSELPEFVFESAFDDNRPHGEGILRMRSGTVLKTTFHYGAVPDGAQGEITWPNGTRYRGGLRSRESLMPSPHGKGVMEYSDGTVYDGEFKQGRLDGPGVLKRVDGEVRTGTFVDGQLEGKGSVVEATQTRYEGELRAGNYQGQGRMEFANGTRYEGSFVAGKFQGKGKLSYSDGSVAEGDFLAGELHGAITMLYADGTRYIGQYLNGRRDGEGTITYASGRIEAGEWKAGWLSGKCKITAAQSLYEGTCFEGKASGTGRLANKASNLMYEGGFLNDQFDGKGSLHVGEMAYEGTFKAGVIEGPGVLSVGKLTMQGDFKVGVLARGTITEDDGRTFEIDAEKGAILEVLKDGTKRPLDELPPDVTI